MGQEIFLNLATQKLFIDGLYLFYKELDNDQE